MSIYRPETLRYAKLDSVAEERALMNNYYVDLIRAFGVDVTYYRRDTRKSSGSLDSLSVYGYNSAPTFSAKTGLRTLLQMNEYSFLVGIEGFVPSDKAFAFFGIGDFATSFVEDAGRFNSFKIHTAEGVALAKNGTILVPFESEVYRGTARIPITAGASAKGVEAEIASASAPCYSVALNPYIRRSFSTDYRNGYFSANVLVDYDATSNKVKYRVYGDVLYSDFFSNERILTEIHPNPGDVIELDYHTEDGVKEQYEITEVVSRKPTDSQSDGLSPLLGKYVYRCAVVRRISGGESLEPEKESKEARNAVMDFSQRRSEALEKDSHAWNNEDADNYYGGYDQAKAFRTDRDGEVDKCDWYGAKDTANAFDYSQFREDWTGTEYADGKYVICSFTDGTRLFTDGADLFWGDGTDDPNAVALTHTGTEAPTAVPEAMYLRAIDGQLVFVPYDQSAPVPLTTFTSSLKGVMDFPDGFTYKDVGYVSNQGYYVFKNARIAINSFSKTVLKAFADGGDEPQVVARR